MIEKHEKLKFRHRVRRFYTSTEWLGDEEGKVRRRIYVISFSVIPIAIAISVIANSGLIFFILGFSCIGLMTSAQLVSKNRWIQTEGRQAKHDLKQAHGDIKEIIRITNEDREKQ